MAQGYYALQHFNQWLFQDFLGSKLLDAEKEIMSRLLREHYGKHVLLLGVPQQHSLLSATEIHCKTLMCPFEGRQKQWVNVESGLDELPVYSGSIDLVLLPHTMEFLDNPRQLLAEACRVVKPEGLIVVLGFNPLSAWGAKKIIANHKEQKTSHGIRVPWSANFILAGEVIRWLKLSDFVIERQQTLLFRPPTKKLKLFHMLKFLEKLGSTCFPGLGGVYTLVARAKVMPLTPIKLSWKQKLGTIASTTSIPGHVRLQRCQHEVD